MTAHIHNDQPRLPGPAHVPFTIHSKTAQHIIATIPAQACLYRPHYLLTLALRFSREASKSNDTALPRYTRLHDAENKIDTILSSTPISYCTKTMYALGALQTLRLASVIDHGQ